MRLWLLALLVACGGSQPHCELPARPTAPTQPFLWRVQRGDGPILWLYGTVHNGGTADVAPAAWRALDSSTLFVSELGDSEPDPGLAGELARVKSGKGLDQLLPADDWYDLRDALEGRVREDDLRRARPWFAMTQLMSKMSPAPSPTMDFALAKHARDRNIGVAQLESWRDQLAALDAAVGVADLQQALHARHTMGCALSTMLVTYATGDLPAMQKLLLVEGTASLLAPRNQKWLPQLESYLTDKGAFVAVGLGHLAGDDGLPALFARAGASVERVAR
jgi:uncharacterized protein